MNASKTASKNAYLTGYYAGVTGDSCPDAFKGILGASKGFFDSAYARGFRNGAGARTKAEKDATEYADMMAKKGAA